MRAFIFAFSFFLFFAMSSSLQAQYKKKKFSFEPEIGIWIGPAAPLGTLSNHLNTYIGVGVFARFNLPVKGLAVDTGLSYSNFNSDSPAVLHLVPMYAGLIYTLPIKFAMKFHIKTNFGTTFVKTMPNKKSGWFPNFVLGVGGAFPTGRHLYVGLHIDYILVIESYVKKPYPAYKPINGHFMHFGVSVSYRFGGL